MITQLEKQYDTQEESTTFIVCIIEPMGMVIWKEVRRQHIFQGDKEIKGRNSQRSYSPSVGRPRDHLKEGSDDTNN